MKLTPCAIAMLACYSSAASRFVLRPDNFEDYQDHHLDQACEKELIWVGKK